MTAVSAAPASSPVEGRRRARSGPDHLLTAVMLLAVAGAVAVLVPQLLGYQLAVVRSDSMAPVLRTGDLIVSTTVAVESVQAGDVITFRDEVRDIDVTHRVVSIVAATADEFVVTTRGDANPTAERWQVPGASPVGRLERTVPRAGVVVGAVAGMPGRVAAIVTAMLLAGAFVVRRVWR